MGEKKKPILFSGPMVRAILDGTKSQTRRVMKVQPPDESYQLGTCMSSTVPRDVDRVRWLKMVGLSIEDASEYFTGPYPVGTELWVRETWRTFNILDREKPSEMPLKTPIQFRADNVFLHSDATPDFHLSGRWRPSIFMPRWASRITLRVTDVRAKRVQDISEEDALAEGVREITKDGMVKKYAVYDFGDYSSTPWQDMPRDTKTAFRVLWDSINAKRGYSWKSNPWVWCYTFERIK